MRILALHDEALARLTVTVLSVAFDRQCLYRRRAETCRTGDDRPLRMVLGCPTLAGVSDTSSAGLGYALVRRGGVRGDAACVDRGLPDPPAVLDVASTRIEPAGDATDASIAALTERRAPE